MEKRIIRSASLLSRSAAKDQNYRLGEVEDNNAARRLSLGGRAMHAISASFSAGGTERVIRYRKDITDANRAELLRFVLAPLVGRSLWAIIVGRRERSTRRTHHARVFDGMFCDHRHRNWRLLFPRLNAKAEWDCVFHRERANKSAMVLAFRIPPGRDWRFGSSDHHECSRSAQRMGLRVRAAVDMAMDFRRPWYSGGRARGLLGFTVSHCSR
jgi:hypothetical protein